MPSDARFWLEKIRALPPGNVRLMEVCGTHTMAIARAGIKSLLPEGLVSESVLSEKEAIAAAEDALRALGYERMSWEEKTRRGNILDLRGSAEEDGVAGLDRELALSVALDDGSLMALDLSASENVGAESEWPLSEQEAKAQVPPGLHLRTARRVTLSGPDGRSLACWELQCLDDRGQSVKVYLNADSGKQEEIRIG